MAKALRSFLLTLLISLLIGFAIGLWIRTRMERPVRYIGSAPTYPLDVRYASAVILEPRQHEQPIG